MGAAIDRTTHKKAFMATIAVVNMLCPLALLLTSDVATLYALAVLDGAAAAASDPLVSAVALGIAGPAGFVPDGPLCLWVCLPWVRWVQPAQRGVWWARRRQRKSARPRFTVPPTPPFLFFIGRAIALH